MESVNGRIINVSDKTHIRYWTDIIERNANIAVEGSLVGALETYPNY